MGQIRDRMEADLALRGAAKGTCAVYLRYAAAFVAFFMRPPTQLANRASNSPHRQGPIASLRHQQA